MVGQTARQAILDIVSAALTHLPMFAEKFSSGAGHQEVAQQRLIFFRGPWSIHPASFEKNLRGLAF
jgi:hypothetical protein